MVLPPIGALLPVVETVIDRVVPDSAAAETAKRELQAELVKTANPVNLEQVRTNQVEAQHRSVFVADWRTAIGWAWAGSGPSRSCAASPAGGSGGGDVRARLKDQILLWERVVMLFAALVLLVGVPALVELAEWSL